MTELRNTILSLLETATQTVKNTDPMDLHDLIKPHKDYPHCETFVVELVNRIKSATKDAGRDIHKTTLLEIYNRYSGDESPNEARVTDIMSALT